jgi:NTP pyrophosphatase (non-canonical NTP hydrolase)
MVVPGKDYKYDPVYEQSRMDTLCAAVEKYGVTNQMLMAVEEAAELIQAINKYFRCDGKNEAITTDLLGEIADMRIMLDQLTIIFGGAELMAIEQIKVDRLSKRIKEANGVQ